MPNSDGFGSIPAWNPHAWKERERICERFGCVERFIPKRRNQKYHSEECRYAAWSEERVRIRIGSIQRLSLAANEKNIAVRVMRYFRTLPTESKLCVMQWCEEESKATAKLARECATAEDYHGAEHWRAFAVFTKRLKQLLSR